MNSFTILAVGHIATDPELEGSGDRARLQIPLIGNDYAGKDDEGGAVERTTQVYFTAFGSKAQTIAKYCRKGDQLICRARMQSNNYTDRAGEKVYSYNYVIEDFTFGAPGKAKREELAQEF